MAKVHSVVAAANRNDGNKVLKIPADASGTSPGPRLKNADSDAVDGVCNCTGRQNWGNWATALTGKQHAATTAACCAMCTAHSECVMWEYAPEEGSCWLKADAGGCIQKHQRVSGSCSRPPAPPPPARTIDLNVQFDITAPARAHTAKEGFVSYCLDWWGPSQGARPEGWGSHANVLELDFNSPKLQALVRALGPSFLRIGGSLDKDVVYQMPGTHEPCPRTSERGPVPPGGLCLNTSRWDALHGFARATNSRIVFGLSYPQVAGPDPQASAEITAGGTGIWNSSQAEALFAYSKQKGYTGQTTLAGFELGEELTGFKLGSSAFGAYMASYHRASELLKSIFAQEAANDAVPKLMGPCPGMAWPELADWFPAFLKGTAGALDVAVYHSYNQIKPDPPRVLYLNQTPPSGDVATQKGASAGGTGWQAKAMAGWAKDAGIPVWLGEGGPHNGGGGGEYASTFVSSFGYMDTLGTLASLNHSVFARQTLVGGNYELLRCSSGQPTGPEPSAGCDFEPHPDYWVALLWRMLMGPTVLSLPELGQSAQAAENVRLHVHCTSSSNAVSSGAISIAFTNTADSITFRLTLPRALQSQRRNEYHLTAANRTLGFSSRTLSLNDGPALTVGEDGTLPPLTPSPRANNGVIVLEPVSLGFIVFPDAKVQACL